MSSVSLSGLNRAALAAKEGYWWINGIALALSAVIARMSAVAYGEIDQADRAFVCIVAQALAIALAILARRALTGQMPLSAFIAALLAGGCAWWASHGQWYGDADRNGEPMVIFMAALEPALFLLAEHIKEGRETLRAAHVKEELETAEALRLARERDERNFRPTPPAPTSETPAPPPSETNVTPIRRKRSGAVETVATAATILAGQGALPFDATASPVAMEQPFRRPIVARKPSMDEIEQAREALARRGQRPSYRTVAAYIGVRKSDVEAVWPTGVPLAA